MRNFNIEFKQIDLNMLEVHPRVQRDRDEAHIADIVEHFNNVALNPLTVMYSTTGQNRKRWVIDGQHTLAAAKAKGLTKLWCKVISAHGNTEINEIFHLLNERVKPLKPVDGFSLNAEFDDTTTDFKIARALRHFDLMVGKTLDTRTIRCAAAVRDAWDNLGEQNFSTFAMLLSRISESGSMITRAVVNGVAAVVKKYGGYEDDIYDIAQLLEEDLAGILDDAKAMSRGKSVDSNPRAFVAAVDEALMGYAA